MSSLGHVEGRVIMSPDKVVQELRLLRYDRRPSLTSVAQAAGISRTELYRVINSGRASKATGTALERALRDVTSTPCQNPRSAASRTRL